jgi:hypothetical protein
VGRPPGAASPETAGREAEGPLQEGGGLQARAGACVALGGGPPRPVAVPVGVGVGAGSVRKRDLREPGKNKITPFLNRFTPCNDLEGAKNGVIWNRPHF